MYKIMIVDDELSSQDMLQHFIDTRLPNYEVSDICNNGLEAISAFQKKPADIVLLDIRMPMMDGMTFLEQLSKVTRDFVAIILSGFGEFEYAKTAMRLGVSHYLLKPVDYDELTQALDSASQTLDYKRFAYAQTANVADSPSIEEVILGEDLTDIPEDILNRRIENAIAYINQHYDKDVTRDTVAAAVYMSGAYFSRCFKAITGVSYKEYLTEVRMRKAMDLLKTNMKISDISSKVGYPNPNRFNINFRQYTSYTPSEYRIHVLKML